MKKVECWISDDGQLDQSPLRAKAHDLVKHMDNIYNRKHHGGVRTSSRIGFSEALEILENSKAVQEHIEEYLMVLEVEELKKAGV